MKSRNWQAFRKKVQAIRYPGACSLKPSTFQPEGPPEYEPLIEKPSPAPPAGSVTAALAAMRALVEEAPIPEPVLSEEEQSARRARLDKQRDRMRRFRADQLRPWETQLTRSTKNDKLHRYYTSIRKGNGPRNPGA